MHLVSPPFLGLALLLALGGPAGAQSPAPPAPLWSWQQTHARVDPRGDLSWEPRPFVFERGASVRYIDFAEGDDTHSGENSASAWKHHPWDPQAGGRAAAATGRHTYVFKRGVTYRGRLLVREAGRAGDPIRLTSDPSWGTGEAVLCGSERITGWAKGTTHPDIPEPGEVWWVDLPFAPRSVWSVAADGGIRRIPLARTPNWKVSNPDDVKSEWWEWDNPRRAFGNVITNRQGRTVHLGIDTRHIRDKPESYFRGALIWPEYGWVMSGPYPTEVEVVDLEYNGLGFAGWTGGGAGGVIMRGMRYYLEDKPHYLDDPEGEYWFDKRGEGGRLHLRLPPNADPNQAGIEAGRWMNLVDGPNVEHLHITGLTFRFTTSEWSITSSTWDFRTRPYGLRPEAHPGCVRVWGSGTDIRIAHCRFEQVFFPIRIRSLLAGQRVDGVCIEDNEFRYTDGGILSVSDGSGWGYAALRGRLGEVRILRNRSLETGRRPSRFSTGTGIEVSGARTLEIAGNIVERSYAQGIDVHGAKVDGMWGDVPFTRHLIHHNKVWESMLNCNDYGGIETWQGGPFYVFDNLSYNALGYRHWERYSGRDAGFGHAYYLDGAFKNYHFNNIAWGKSRDLKEPTVNCSAFQEIHSYQNTFFHNTVYNYDTGSRRQAPEAGRNKYLGNIWDGIGQFALRHADPARTPAEGNAADAGPAKERYDLETNAYQGNVFHECARLGVLEPSGRWLPSFEDFQSALHQHRSLAADLGVVSTAPVLADPAHGDFRPTQRSAAEGRGVKVFVPWALSAVVGEWGFYRPGGDPSILLDEHWYMTDYHVSRETYRERPMVPLRAVNVTAADYTDGPLEDWTLGALRFSPAKRQFARVPHAEMMQPFSFRERRVSRHEDGGPEPVTLEGAALRNLEVRDSNLLIEAYFRTEPGHTGGVIVEKHLGTGYGLTVGSTGGLRFQVDGAVSATNATARPTTSASVEGKVHVNDGGWHHALVEADRKARRLTIYVDGRVDATAPGPDESESLANPGDVHVGGTPEGRYLNGALDFLRIAQGTLADADTTIEELVAWEFDGPFLRDFTGRKPTSLTRSAGALEPLR